MILDLIKLGGSVLTDKRGRLALRQEVLARIAREIAESLPDERWQTGAGLVIVHGAGSFGHPRALECGLGAAPSGGDDGRSVPRGPRPLPLFSEPSLRDAVVAIQEEIRRLHLALLQELVQAGVPAMSLPGAGFLRMSGGRLERPDLTELLRAGAQGFVPVTCGDVVIDSAQGPRIVSADRVTLEICRQAEPERVTFVTDVDGVFDRDPYALARIAGPGRRTFVLSGLVPGRLAAHLRGDDVPGTSIHSR